MFDYNLNGTAIAEIKELVLEASSVIEPIAERQGVGLATIRTQIGSVRAKTGAASIRALVRQVAMLPPLVSALQGFNTPAATPFPLPRRAARS